MLRLNETGKDIVEGLQNGLSNEQIVSRLMEEYEVDEDTATKSVERIIRQMLDAGIAQA